MWFLLICYDASVRRNLLISIVVFLLLMSLCSPILEQFDHWDLFPQSGDDTILSVISILAFLGLVFISLRHELLVGIPVLAIPRLCLVPLSTVVLPSLVLWLAAGPPLLLRI